MQLTGFSVSGALAGCIAYAVVLIANWLDPSHIIMCALTADVFYYTCTFCQHLIVFLIECII